MQQQDIINFNLKRKNKLEKLADEILNINSKSGEKSKCEYPILSERQLYRRKSIEKPLSWFSDISYEKKVIFRSLQVA